MDRLKRGVCLFLYSTVKSLLSPVSSTAVDALYLNKVASNVCIFAVNVLVVLIRDVII